MPERKHVPCQEGEAGALRRFSSDELAGQLIVEVYTPASVKEQKLYPTTPEEGAAALMSRYGRGYHFDPEQVLAIARQVRGLGLDKARAQFDARAWDATHGGWVRLE